MRTTAAVVVAAILAALPACSSSYIPQARGRVSMVMMNGAPAYVRDGQVYPHGFLGNGLRRAVRGNPGAERAAREYHDRQRDGLLLGAAGLACSVIAAVKMASDLSEQQQQDGTADEVPMSAWVSVGCLLASVGGAGYIITAEPYRYDAINIFNDTTPQWMPTAPGAPGAYPPGYGPMLPRPRRSACATDASPALRMRDARERASSTLLLLRSS